MSNCEINENIDKFLHFGCWNNLNEGKGNLKNVMDLLAQYISNHQTELIIVAGDNYYPNKTEVDGNKKKTIYPKKLTNGFNSLPSNVQIDMIMGNHDLETNSKKTQLYIDNEDGSPEIAENGNCQILQLETNSVQPNVRFELMKCRILANGTFLLLIDSSIYSGDVGKFLKCYNILLRKNFSDPQELIDYQNTFIDETIATHKNNIQNLVIVGHHPITGFKNKKEKKLMDDIPNFNAILKNIYDTLGNDTRYYYLCADYHSYQSGTIKYNFGMEVKQYIAGTGGTELNENIQSNGNTLSEYSPDNLFEYVMHDNVKNWGFLECNITSNGLVCNPIFIPNDAIGGKYKRRKSMKKRRNCKKKKTHKRRKSSRRRK